jgi:hypothetical protein
VPPAKRILMYRGSCEDHLRKCQYYANFAKQQKRGGSSSSSEKEKEPDASEDRFAKIQAARVSEVRVWLMDAIGCDPIEEQMQGYPVSMIDSGLHSVEMIHRVGVLER